MADWGGSISVVLHSGSSCSLSRVMNGRIMCRGITGSCHSAATSDCKMLLFTSLVMQAAL